MQELTTEEAFGRELPKWPQLKLTGLKVTLAQAKEIIMRTDSFVGAIHYGGGNNKKWNDWAKRTLFGKLLDKVDDDQIWHVADELRAHLGFVTTTYINNNWLSSAFVYGPHGWCSPEGEISYIDNVGKWPSVEEVFQDLQAIISTFPFLTMTATLMSGESCEDETKPIVTFVCRDTKIVLTDEHTEHHYPVLEIDRSDKRLTERFERWVDTTGVIPRTIEQGVPDEWIVEYGAKWKLCVDHTIAKLAALRKADEEQANLENT